ncbi:cupin domain-containing protein [Empedobacter falsenii]
MNLEELHQQEKEVSATLLFKGEMGTSTAIRLEEKAILKEHITKTAALLVCVSGITTYEDEKGQQLTLKQGDYISIEPHVKHWLNATCKSHLILLK